MQVQVLHKHRAQERHEESGRVAFPVHAGHAANQAAHQARPSPNHGYDQPHVVNPGITARATRPAMKPKAACPIMCGAVVSSAP
jgi:hypothetical protein